MIANKIWEKRWIYTVLRSLCSTPWYDLNAILKLNYDSKTLF